MPARGKRAPLSRKTTWAAIAGAVVLVLTGTVAAWAAVDPSSLDTEHYAWNPPTTATAIGIPSAPVVDTDLQTKGRSYTYISQGSTVLSLRNVADRDGLAGSVRWSRV